jgi:hypothetical protein
MITVRLNGGLGNQMFQYAMAKALASHNNTKLVLDTNEFDTYDLRDLELDKYNIKAEVINKNYVLKKIIKKLRLDKLFPTYYVEKSLKYDSNIKDLNNDIYLEGYFQNERYFLDIRDELLKDFTIKDSLSSYTQQIEKEIFDEDVSVSLHIRRGDYISDTNTNNVHGTCDLEYYKKAMNLMKGKYNNIKYFIFSDDISWVKDNLKILNAIYIDSKEKRIPHEDIYLMSLCSHNIIANSSFSWWGAWLNRNNDKVVIAPERWFIDEKMYEQSSEIVSKSWLKI